MVCEGDGAHCAVTAMVAWLRQLSMCGHSKVSSHSSTVIKPHVSQPKQRAVGQYDIVPSGRSDEKRRILVIVSGLRVLQGANWARFGLFLHRYRRPRPCADSVR